jgi:hypothetical protein
MRSTSIPRSKAEKRSDMRGEQVRLGDWMKIDLVAVARIRRMKVLSGVGGGVDVEKGWRMRFAWWGDGRRMVCVSSVSWVKEACLMSEESCPFKVGNSDEAFVVDIGGSALPPLPQNAVQKSKSLRAMSPCISMQPSNQSSQLTLHDGIKAIFRSTRINFGCMTLKGLTNTLFTTRSRPVSSSGRGNPSPAHDEGG